MREPPSLGCAIPPATARMAQTQWLAQRSQDAERDIRARLAATLHDGIGQTLQGLSLGLKQARTIAKRGEAVSVELIERLITEVGDVLGELRVLSRELRPLALECLSFADAVQLHCCETARLTGRPIRVRTDGVASSLDDRTKEQCFLAFREALSNALRHAQASRIEVVLRVRRPDWLSLFVIDDGDGFDTRRACARPTGLGLRLMGERVAAVLGGAAIRSRIGRGTLVRIRVPLRRQSIPGPSASAAPGR